MSVPKETNRPIEEVRGALQAFPLALRSLDVFQRAQHVLHTSYVLPDGTAIDMGECCGHDFIRHAFPAGSPYAANGGSAIRAFMAEGNVRVISGEREFGVQFVRMPTPAQISALVEYGRSIRDLTRICIDMENDKGELVAARKIEFPRLGSLVAYLRATWREGQAWGGERVDCAYSDEPAPLPPSNSLLSKRIVF